LEIAFENLKSIIRAEKCKTERLAEQFEKVVKDPEIVTLLKGGRNE
jgi:guanylate kinase